MIKKIFTALLFLIPAIPLAAQEADDFEGRIEKSTTPPTLQELIDYNISNNAKNGFSPH